MSEYVSSKGTTGLRVAYNHTHDSLQVLANEGSVLVYTVREYPDHLRYVSNDEIFDWVMENYSSDIAECLEALGL
jgi:hypothetical protein